MKTSIAELQSMNEEEKTMRALDRMVDRAVLDSKLDRALSVKWAELKIQVKQYSQDEIDTLATNAMFGGR